MSKILSFLGSFRVLRGGVGGGGVGECGGWLRKCIRESSKLDL